MLQRRLRFLFSEFIRLESASGIVLLLCTLVAIGSMNSPIAKVYYQFWHMSLGGVSLLHWINEGLMSTFFFLVGLEIKRELTEGELSRRGKALLPLAAGVGGMLVPALIYLLFANHSRAQRGWGIPMATDIAFAVGILALLGNRIPQQLKVFLLALAIVDDIGAVFVIALFYTQHLAWAFLFLGFGLLAALAILNRKGLRRTSIFLLAGVPIWLCFFKSGVHATVAGALLAFVIPSGAGRGIERFLHSWVVFGIVPLFAFANAGVPFVGTNIFNGVCIGIILGLVLGKQIGITLFSWLAVKLGIASLPGQISWRQVHGIACLGGIGFTMSIFIAGLAFDETGLVDSAKVAVLAASSLSACLGIVALRRIQ